MTRTQILVYGDSVGWGMVPGTRRRFSFETRWPGVLELALNRTELRTVRVIENCLAGRRTVWEDPFRPGRNGSVGLSEAIEANSPLALVILQLGTNDFQAPSNIKAWAACRGVSRLVDIVRQSPIEPGMPRPAILVLAPPAITEPSGENAAKFEGAAQRSNGFSSELEAMALSKAVRFFDVNTITSASTIDGIHLDADQHLALGTSLAASIVDMLTADEAIGTCT